MIGRFVTSVVIFTCAATSASAADYFLTIGGGYSPTGNQISLEKNVKFFRELLSDSYREPVPHDVYFSDGTNPGRDLQYVEPTENLPRANVLLARIFRQTRYLGNRYRSHELEEVKGGSSKKNIEKWFNEVGKKLVPGDRLFLYVTAHGGKSTDKKRPTNSALYLWNSEKILASELADQMKKLPQGVSVVTVMVQCYSGGFSNILFNSGDSGKGMSERDICGFYATVHDRVAAGCTPDINEENYREYSSYFWAALLGRTRTGGEVAQPDFDNDGAVSLAEAHAYALLTSDTIDISVKTSDTFLRKYSRLAPPKPTTSLEQKVADKRAAAGKLGGSPLAPPMPEVATNRWITTAAPIEQVVANLDAVDRAVIDGLSKELNLTGKNRYAEAEKLAAKLVQDKKKLDGKIRQKSGEAGRYSSEISKAVRLKWPELSNRWDPLVEVLLEEKSDEVVAMIEGHTRYKAFEKARGELKVLSQEKMGIDRQWVKCQRLKRAIENSVLAANLELVASSDLQKRYQNLLSLESQMFGSEPTAGGQDVTAAGTKEPVAVEGVAGSEE